MDNTTEPKILSFADIQAVDDLEEVTVQLPLLGGAVKIRPLTLAETEQITRESQVPDRVNGGEKADIGKRNRLYMWKSLVEPALTPEQINALFLKSGRALLPLLNAISELNSQGKEAVVAAEDSFREQPDQAIVPPFSPEAEVPASEGHDAGDDHA